MESGSRSWVWGIRLAGIDALVCGPQGWARGRGGVAGEGQGGQSRVGGGEAVHAVGDPPPARAGTVCSPLPAGGMMRCGMSPSTRCFGFYAGVAGMDCGSFEVSVRDGVSQVRCRAWC
ncbi:hypothetical protein GCM10017771_95590 [Streptomyces capitiformicae]|uniref:Uncharacterized protein n=1 Tax=Streptomyces capitiformicae TaxID=2014920 RepID=A0A918ZWK8_9ACTN|nr:hypothetical protein GCM10017771_95590 [Streptomyces capitiformicae]